MISAGKFIHAGRFFIALAVLIVAGGVSLYRVYSVPVERTEVVAGQKEPLPLDGPAREALLAQAFEAERVGRLPEAIAAYEKVLLADPDFAPAYLKLGMIYAHLSLSSRAEEAYLKAIDKGLSDPDIFLFLGYIKEGQGDLKEALAYYQKAGLAGSRNPVLYFNMGNAHARLGDQAAALGSLKRAVVLNEKYLDAYVNLSIVSAQAGEYADALFYLEKAEKLGYQAPVQFKSDLTRELKKKK